MIDRLKALEEVCWKNPKLLPFGEAVKGCSLSMDDIADASRRLDRFASYFSVVFPETAENGGLLESPLKEIPSMKTVLERDGGCSIGGRLFIKLDSHLPVSGSQKPHKTLTTSHWDNLSS